MKDTVTFSNHSVHLGKGTEVGGKLEEMWGGGGGTYAVFRIGPVTFFTGVVGRANELQPHEFLTNVIDTATALRADLPIPPVLDPRHDDAVDEARDVAQELADDYGRDDDLEMRRAEQLGEALGTVLPEVTDGEE